MAAPPHIARENGKKGGRPKGRKSATTLEREKVQVAIRERVMQHADQLFNAQLQLAVGIVHVFRIEEYEIDGKKAGERRHVHVTDPREITKFLDEHEGGNGIVGEHFYYIAEKDPDNRAIDSMFDRTFGKAVQTTDITTGGEKFEMDDIRALLALLPKERQNELYAIITGIIAEAELLRGGKEIPVVGAVESGSH